MPDIGILILTEARIPPMNISRLVKTLLTNLFSNSTFTFKLYGQPNNLSQAQGKIIDMLKSNFIYAFLFFLIIPILFFSLLGQNSDGELHIGIIGDQTGAYDLDLAYEILESAVGKLKQKSPDLVLHVGDMVESIKGVNDFDDYNKYFDRAINIMNNLDCPWFLTAGDHDVNPSGFKPGSSDRSRETWFKTLCNKVDLPLKESLYYSFDFRGYHFISLYSLENLHTDPRWGPIFLNKMSADQNRE